MKTYVSYKKKKKNCKEERVLLNLFQKQTDFSTPPHLVKVAPFPSLSLVQQHNVLVDRYEYNLNIKKTRFCKACHRRVKFR